MPSNAKTQKLNYSTSKIAQRAMLQLNCINTFYHFRNLGPLTHNPIWDDVPYSQLAVETTRDEESILGRVKLH
jgi:hypothetical protein